MKDIFNILAGGGGLLLATIPLEKVGVVYLDSLHKVNLYVKEKIKLYTLYIYIYIYINTMQYILYRREATAIK